MRKNRSGAHGTVELIFQKEYNKLSSISEERGTKMTDAFTDVAKMKKIKRRNQGAEGQVVEMTLKMVNAKRIA